MDVNGVPIPLVPHQASTLAKEIDPIFWVLVLLTVIFTLGVFAAVTFLAIKYRAGNKVDRTNPVDSHLGLELTWSIIPMILCLGVFVWNAKPFATIFKPPANAMEIYVIGKRWMWHIQHKNGVRENNELHVPINRPVKLVMISQDVLHDFYIPDFRIKHDVIPGRYYTMWFEATRPGRYRIFCAQYCGMAHSEMVGWVTAMEPADYQKWLDTGGEKVRTKKPTMEQLGQELYEQLNCGSCHGNTDGRRGPTLYGLPGKDRVLTTGQKVPADDDYLRESILNPNDKVTQGYQPLMPSYKGQLSEEKVLQLIAYMKSLGTPTDPTPKPATSPAAKGQGSVDGEGILPPAKTNSSEPSSGGKE